ncbi:hypothetical protein [Reichenbachiella versicolor]|uniref:hypothetical protein n=1 Tax=Reichenbachiella versicolor TaxID=1821036 RepID=UPI0013A5B0CC|nr:hypothetical protein [Reichenbachiella versicolor]
MKTFLKLFTLLILPFICISCDEDELPTKAENQDPEIEITNPTAGRGGRFKPTTNY